MSHTSQSQTDADVTRSEHNKEPDKDANPHLNQSQFREWKAYSIGESTIIVHDVPESSVSCYRVTGTTRNPRAVMTADRILYEGKIVEPWFDDELRCVTFTHCWAGRVGRVTVSDWFDHPVILLESAPFVSDGDVLSAFESRTE